MPALTLGTPAERVKWRQVPDEVPLQIGFVDLRVCAQKSFEPLAGARQDRPEGDMQHLTGVKRFE